MAVVPGPIDLEFEVGALGHQCRVTIGGQVVSRITKFKLEAEWDCATRVELEGYLGDRPISFRGRLLPDAD